MIYKIESIVKQQGQEMKSEQKLLDYQTTEYGIKFPFKQDQGQMMMVTKKSPSTQLSTLLYSSETNFL